jgi:hypothetical protein
LLFGPIHTLDLAKKLRLAPLELFMPESPVIRSLGFQLWVDANGVGVLDFSKGIKVQLLKREKRERMSTRVPHMSSKRGVTQLPFSPLAASASGASRFK